MMNLADRKLKNKSISQSFKNTLLKRQGQLCKVIKVKVNKSRLNRQQQEQLKMLFVEAKWIYNHILNESNNGVDVFSIDSKNIKVVNHYNKDREYIQTELKYIGSSVKQSLVKGIQSSIKTLAKLKKKGQKVGALKFKSDYNSINFKQLGITHDVLSNNWIRLQGIKKPLYVRGLEQLSVYKNYDIANCKLLKHAGDYFIALTIYIDKEEIVKQTEFKEDIVGIDFGCETTFTLSNGLKFNMFVEESDRLKRIQRKISKSKKESNNRYKLRIKLQKEYKHITNQKDDIANKFVNYLLTTYKHIVIQDEQIGKWKFRHGKKVHHSILGRVKSKLMQSEHVTVLSKWVPTTKLCRDCGYIHKNINVWDREFICPECGVVYDRDIHAAQNMVWIYENYNVGTDYTEFKRVDFEKWLNAIFQRVKHEDADSSDQH